MPSNKQYIIKKCDGFTRTQNLAILNFLQEMNIKICEGADGSRINLDALSKRQLAKLKKKIKETIQPIETKYQIN
jgi:hypothetical protein